MLKVIGVWRHTHNKCFCFKDHNKLFIRKYSFCQLYINFFRGFPEVCVYVYTCGHRFLFCLIVPSFDLLFTTVYVINRNKMSKVLNT